MSAAVRQSDHRARIAQQFGNSILVGVEHRVAEFHPQVVFDPEVEESVEAVAAAVARYFGDRAAPERAHRGIPDLLDFHPLPTAGENSRTFELAAKALAKGRVAVEFLLDF